MFRISAITRVGLVAVACAAVAAPSALAKPPVKSLYGYAMSYTPTKAIRTPAKPVNQTAAAGDDPYLSDVCVRPGESLGGPDGGPAVPRPALESKGTSAKADTQADIERMRRIWTDRD